MPEAASCENVFRPIMENSHRYLKTKQQESNAHQDQKWDI